MGTRRNFKSKTKLKFAARESLLGAEAAGDDVGDKVIFGANGIAGEAAEKRDLADVSERVGDGGLEKGVDGAAEGGVGGEDFVEAFESGEETGKVGFPIGDRGFAPFLIARGDGSGPVKEIADVSEDLAGSASTGAGVEIGEAGGRAADGFGAAVGEGGESVAKEFAVGFGWGGSKRHFCFP